MTVVFHGKLRPLVAYFLFLLIITLLRNDSYFGDDITFDHLVFDRFISQFAGYDLVPLSVVARARAESVLYASKQHPDFFFNASILNRSISESALYTSVLGDPITGGPKTGWIKVLFGKWRNSSLRTKGLVYSRLHCRRREASIP